MSYSSLLHMYDVATLKYETVNISENSVFLKIVSVKPSPTD